MLWIGSRLVVLEGLVVRDVILARRGADRGVGLGAIGEAALEPAPAQSFGAEQVTDVAAAHLGRTPGVAVVEEWLGIAEDGACALLSRHARLVVGGERGRAGGRVD